MIETPMAFNMSLEDRQKREKAIEDIPLKRFGVPRSAAKNLCDLEWAAKSVHKSGLLLARGRFIAWFGNQLAKQITTLLLSQTSSPA